MEIKMTDVQPVESTQTKKRGGARKQHDDAKINFDKAVVKGKKLAVTLKSQDAAVASTENWANWLIGWNPSMATKPWRASPKQLMSQPTD